MAIRLPLTLRDSTEVAPHIQDASLLLEALPEEDKQPEPGDQVFGRDGRLLGTVIETSATCFRVSRMKVYRYWLTRELIREIDGERVLLHTHGDVLGRYRHRECQPIPGVAELEAAAAAREAARQT